MGKLLLFSLPAALFGAEITGTWSGTIDVPDTANGTTIRTAVEAVFEQKGAAVSGGIGRQRDANKESIQKGAVDGAKLTFEVVSGETPSAMRFTLTVDGDRIGGEMRGKVDVGEIVGKVSLARKK